MSRAVHQVVERPDKLFCGIGECPASATIMLFCMVLCLGDRLGSLHGDQTEIKSGFTHENIQVTSAGALSPVPELLLKAEFLLNQP